MEQTRTNEHTVVITDIEQLTHNVKRYRTTKPANYHFEAGQATDVAINTEALKNEKRPFTFTGLNEWGYLEFIIKSYNDHDGITKRMGLLRPGAELIIGDPWGSIAYKGPGTFIAGGAGITPFIAILRHLHKGHKLQGNRLLFSNNTHWDIILHAELKEMLRTDLIITLTNEKLYPYHNGRIDADFIKKHSIDPGGYYYLCGPDGMVNAVQQTLLSMGIKESKIVTEK